jgi:hypothetical protein
LKLPKLLLFASSTTIKVFALSVQCIGFESIAAIQPRLALPRLTRAD